MSIDRDKIFKAVGIKPFLLMTFPEGIYYDEYKHMVGDCFTAIILLDVSFMRRLICVNLKEMTFLTPLPPVRDVLKAAELIPNK